MSLSELRRRLEIFQGIIDALGEDADEQTRLAAKNLRKRIVLEQDREALANAGLPVLKIQG